MPGNYSSHSKHKTGQFNENLCIKKHFDSILDNFKPIGNLKTGAVNCSALKNPLSFNDKQRVIKFLVARPGQKLNILNYAAKYTLNVLIQLISDF